MPYTVFYAWQMDRDKKINRWFIHKAAEAAIKTVVAELELEDAPAVEPAEKKDVDPDAETEIELDHDTKDEPGTPPIAETILKKIENCGVFLADVSLVGKTKTADGRTKKLPNANVMIELGAAIKSIGWDRIILVMNRAFGSAEDLPFDLKHRAIRLGYDLEAGEELAEVKKKRDALAKEIADQLRAMDRSGIITRRDREKRQIEAEQMTDRIAEVTRQRHDFEMRVRGNGWHDIQGEAGMLAVSVFPMTPVQLELSNNQRNAARRFLQPINSGEWPIKVTPRSFVTLHRSSDENLPSRGTELLEDGSLYSVWNIMYGQDRFTDHGMGPKVDTSKPWPLHFGEIGEIVNIWLQRVLTGLGEMGVKGPWLIGISLMKTRNCILTPNRTWDVYNGVDWNRACTTEDMIAETALTPSDLELTSAAIGKALKRSWRQIWRHCSINGVPKIHNNGGVTIDE